MRIENCCKGISSYITLVGLAVFALVCVMSCGVAAGQPATTCPTTLPATCPDAQGAAMTCDPDLEAACKYVAGSDRYLHHSKLVRGMKGYGLTVMAGTERVKFEIEIVSVMTQWGPHQDVILAKLKGLDLDKSGIIAGMSGSPCYVVDPADGKEKMIGAVAYGWSWPKEPLCGIQPITQMLASNGLAAQLLAEESGKGSQPAAAATTQPTISSGNGVFRPEGSGSKTGGVKASPEFLAMALDPHKLDYARLAAGEKSVVWSLESGGTTATARTALAVSAVAPDSRLRTPDSNDRATLLPLATPLMISGRSDKAREDLRGLLGPMNMRAVQAGGVASADVGKASTKLQPGSAVAICLVGGDADVTGVGTVTEVIGDHVLIFGHAMNSEGKISIPLAPAFVHTVVSSYEESFKLASSLTKTNEDGTRSPLIVGAAISDESVAVSGKLGPSAPMLPVTVNVTWKDGDRQKKQTFNYQVCRHPRLTTLAVRYCIRDAAWGWHELPEFHTVKHAVEIDFGKLGVFKAANCTSDADVMSAISDASRPIYLLANNPLADPAEAKSVKVDLVIEPGTNSAEILSMKLDGATYRPGDTVSGKVAISRFRQTRTSLPVEFKLPADLPDGKYRLTACDSYEAMSRFENEMPQRFDPRSSQELFDAMQQVVKTDGHEMCLHMPLTKGGMALEKRELADLPNSKASVLADADLPDTHTFRESICRKVVTPYLLRGSATVEITVESKPSQTLLHVEE